MRKRHTLLNYCPTVMIFTRSFGTLSPAWLHLSYIKVSLKGTLLVKVAFRTVKIADVTTRTITRTPMGQI